MPEHRHPQKKTSYASFLHPDSTKAPQVVTVHKQGTWNAEANPPPTEQ